MSVLFLAVVLIRSRSIIGVNKWYLFTSPKPHKFGFLKISLGVRDIEVGRRSPSFLWYVFLRL